MKRLSVCLLIINFVFFTGFVGCGGSSGGGGGGGTTNPTQMYVGEIYDATTLNEVGGVGVDDLGNKLVGIQSTPGSDLLSFALMTLADGTSFYMTVSDGSVEPAGYPTLLTHSSGTITFSNWNTTSRTVDITVTDSTGTETLTGADYSDYAPTASAGAQALNVAKSPGAGRALYYAYSVLKVATCPASLLLTAGTLGWAFGITVASCAVAGTTLWNLFGSDETAVDNAAQNVTEGGNCANVQANSGGTSAERTDCVDNSSAAVEAIGTYMDENGNVGNDGGGGGGFAGSCDSSAAGGLCYNYTGTGYTAESAQGACDAAGSSSTYSSGACPTASALGACTVGSAVSEFQVIYYSTFYSLALAQSSCEAAGGTWNGTYTPPS